MFGSRLAVIAGLALVVSVTGVAVAGPIDGTLASFTDSPDPAPKAAPSAAPGLASSPTQAPQPVTEPATSADRRTTSSARVQAAAAPLSLRLVTFNVLGSLHTEPGGDYQTRAPAELRSQWAADIIRSQRADIVGYQELRPNQITSLRREFPGYYFWPDMAIGSLGRPTTLMWNNAKFAKVSSSYVTVPSMGTTRRMSYVLLQDRATGRRFYYFNVHNSPGNRQAERNRDLAIETAKIRQLRATGVPVLLGGDFNEREHAVCTILKQTDLSSSAGGTLTKGVCTPPSRLRLDWIFGSAKFSGYAMMQPALVRRATDHWIVAATATLN